MFDDFDLAFGAGGDGTSTGENPLQGYIYVDQGIVYDNQGDVIGTLGRQIESGRNVQARYVGQFPVYGPSHQLLGYLSPRQVWAGSVATQMATNAQTSNGTTGGGTSYADQLGLLRERAALESAEAEKQRSWQARQNEMARQNEQRMALAQRITGLFENFTSLQEQARQLQTELLGNDVLRAATAMRGGLQRGTTPYESYMGELSQVANRAQPNISYALQPNADIGRLGVMEQYLRGGLRQMMPQAPALGLAEGGRVALSAGEGVLVGERGPEVMKANPDGTIDVIPLKGSAAFGASIDPRIAENIRSVFAPIYGRLGMSDVPQARPTAWGSTRMQGYGVAEGLQRMGYRPSLFQLSGTPNMYYRDPTGNLFTVSQDMWRQAGFSPSDVVEVGLRDLGVLSGRNEWAPIPALTAPPSETAGGLGLGALTTPMMLPGSEGMILPAPELLAPMWREFDEGTRRLILQAYGLTRQMTPEGALSRIQYFTPRGSAQIGRTAVLG